MNQLETIGSPHRLLQLDLPGPATIGTLGTNLPNLLAPQLDIIAQPVRGQDSKPRTACSPDLEIHLGDICHCALANTDDRCDVGAETRRSRGQPQTQVLRRRLILKSIVYRPAAIRSQDAVQCGRIDGASAAVTGQDGVQIVVQRDRQLATLGPDAFHGDDGHNKLRSTRVSNERAAHRQVQFPDGRLAQCHFQLPALVVVFDEPVGARRNTNLRYPQRSRQPQPERRNWGAGDVCRQQAPQNGLARRHDHGSAIGHLHPRPMTLDLQLQTPRS